MSPATPLLTRNNVAGSGTATASSVATNVDRVVAHGAMFMVNLRKPTEIEMQGSLNGVLHCGLKPIPPMPAIGP
jgi:hypothetical protein